MDDGMTAAWLSPSPVMARIDTLTRLWSPSVDEDFRKLDFPDPAVTLRFGLVHFEADTVSVNFERGQRPPSRTLHRHGQLDLIRLDRLHLLRVRP